MTSQNISSNNFLLCLNADFAVCVKPQGIPSQPDTSGDADMTALLCAELASRKERSELYVVHRLDRGTGGLIVYARTKQASAELSRLIADKDGFKKSYIAAVSGKPSTDTGNYTDFLFRDSAQKKAFTVKGERKGAKLASLDYELCDTVSEGEKTFSLLKIRLNTGRFHQIRAQLASRGMPVYGDGKYGSREKAPHFALWACGLEFTYKGKKYDFHSLPELDTAPWGFFDARCYGNGNENL